VGGNAIIDYILGIPTREQMPHLKLEVVDQKARVMKTQAGNAVAKLIIQRIFQLKREQQELKSLVKSNNNSTAHFIDKTEGEKMEMAEQLEVEIASLRSSYLKLGGSSFVSIGHFSND
jgi:cystathionine beta-lyase family protein involved in aluminum resistance